MTLCVQVNHSRPNSTVGRSTSAPHQRNGGARDTCAPHFHLLPLPPLPHFIPTAPFCLHSSFSFPNVATYPRAHVMLSRHRAARLARNQLANSACHEYVRNHAVGLRKDNMGTGFKANGIERVDKVRFRIVEWRKGNGGCGMHTLWKSIGWPIRRHEVCTC